MLVGMENTELDWTKECAGNKLYRIRIRWLLCAGNELWNNFGKLWLGIRHNNILAGLYWERVNALE